MDNTTISVVIPSFNRSALLKRAVNSVLNQTQLPHEIIVVDDGSTDDTENVVSALGKQVTYIYQKNAGVSVARNNGIKSSTGNWIAFLDSDDEWILEKLSAQLQIIEKLPQCAWHSANHFSGALNSTTHKSNSNFETMDFFTPLTNTYACHTSSTIVKKSVFEEVGYFHPELRFGQHMEMWFRIAAKYPSLGFDNNYLCITHPNSAHSNSNTLDRNLMLIVYENLKTIADNADPDTAHKIRRWIQISSTVQYFKLLQRPVPSKLNKKFNQFSLKQWTLVSQLVRLLPTAARIRLARIISDYLRKTPK